MDRVLVTGGLGFIGSHTVDELIKQGYSVTVLDNFERQVHRGQIPVYKNEQADYIFGDIRHRKSWLRALRDVDGIIHLAATVGTAQSFWEAKKYADVNVSGTALMYEILTKEKKIRKSIEKIVVASSKSIYGEGTYLCDKHGIQYPDLRPLNQLQKKKWELVCPICGNDMRPIGVDEKKAPQTPNPYSVSKFATERLAIDYSNSIGIKTVAFRYFNVYGERQSLSNPYTGVIAIFLSRVKNGRSPFLFEDGKQLRDYVYVKDVAKTNVLALRKGNGVYNLGVGKPVSLENIVSLLNRRLGTNIQPVISGDFRSGDNRHDFADIHHLSRNFNIKDFKELKDGIDSLIKWSENQEAVDSFERAEGERLKYFT